MPRERRGDVDARPRVDREDEEHHEARGWGESGSSRPEAAGLGLRVGLSTWSATARVRGTRGGRGQAGGGRAVVLGVRRHTSLECRPRTAPARRDGGSSSSELRSQQITMISAPNS